MIIAPEKRMEAKKALINKCESCLGSGSGCLVCLRKLTIVDRLAEANIPVNYWFFKMQNYKEGEAKKAILAYIEDIENKLSSGTGLCLAGSYGTGKTTGLCSVLKNAIFRNYTAYYTTMNDLIFYLMDYNTKDEYHYLVTKCQFLVIDEVDARHFSNSEEAQKVLGSNFEKIVRYRIQNSLPVLVGTNHASLEEAFSGQYRRVIESLMLAKMQTVSVLGKDQRKAHV